uniref:Uncharacterized protein n=1 Tax=Octopus bimaculoides TaxID=37653 RepID=A0A0L8GWT9_OCTBM
MGNGWKEKRGKIHKVDVDLHPTLTQHIPTPTLPHPPPTDANPPHSPPTQRKTHIHKNPKTSPPLACEKSKFVVIWDDTNTELCNIIASWEDKIITVNTATSTGIPWRYNYLLVSQEQMPKINTKKTLNTGRKQWTPVRYQVI